MDQPSLPASWFDRPVLKGHALRWEQAVWCVLIFAAVVSRFAMLEPRVISHDEGQHVQLAWDLYRGEGYTPNPMTHGPFQIITVAFSYFLFGAGDFSSRLPAALFGVAAVGILYLFRRWLGRAGAMAAGALMLISPYMLYYSRYVRNEAFVVVWGLLMIFAVGRYLESRQLRFLYLLAAVTALHYATKETAFIYVGLAVIFLFGLLQIQFFLRQWDDRGRRFRCLAFSMAGWLLALGGLVLIVAGRSQLVAQALQTGTNLIPEQMVHTADWLTNRNVQVGVVLLFLSLAGFGAGLWVLLKEVPLPVLREQFPAVDLVVVLSTTLLPQLAAFPMALFNLNPFDPFYGSPLDRLKDVNYLLACMFWLLMVIVPSIVVGLLWNRKQWAIYAGIFFGVYGLLFSVCLTNFGGVLLGLVGAVNYWMAQQEVERGSQPWYYYLLLQVPLYEYLPALLALSAPAVAFFLRRKTIGEGNPTGAEAANLEPAVAGFRKILLGIRIGLSQRINQITAAPMLWLIGYWSIGALAAFTIAGEKMPWLTVHITLPFLLLGGWAVGIVVERIDWMHLSVWPRWIGWLLAPATMVMIAMAAVKLLGNSPPFLGSTQAELDATADFVSCMLAAGVFSVLLRWLWRGMSSGEFIRIAYTGAVFLLALCTVRTAWRASYIEYDHATEFLVYAHGAPGVKTAMSQIEDISRKSHDDLAITIPYDVRSGWLFHWYLREYPNAVNYGERLDRSYADAPVVIVSDLYWQQADRMLSGTHYAFTYMRMWWPMMDYIDLDRARIRNALSDPGYRSALWQIWFNRDYTEYARMTGGDFSLANWPLGERMRLYVRKDLALQIWQYGSEAFTPPVEVDLYANSIRTLEAAVMFGQAGVEPGSFQRPRGIAAAPDGTIYVADTFNHRIQHFDAGGNLLGAWGSYSGTDAGSAENGAFNEPWGVAVGPDGSVYVADTWNFRIQKFSADGEFLAAWGSYTNPENGYQLYGPRAIAVDSQGRVFVADTGNKRILVYDSGGKFLQEIGRPGYDIGQFDEPVGLGFGPDGRLFVADAWNRRIQVFQEFDGYFTYQFEWTIEGWEGQSTDTKPYLAVSEDGRIWITDPGNARVLVFDLAGNFLFTFGAYGSDGASFAMPTGIAVSSDGRIYISDTDNNRVMVFTAP